MKKCRDKGTVSSEKNLPHNWNGVNNQNSWKTEKWKKKHFKQGLERFGNKSDSGSYVTGGYGLTVLEGAGSSK